MGLVHTLVAEILGKFINPVEAAHNKSLKVELICNTQIERNIQSVVMGYEGACGRSARNALQDRCLYLQAARLIKVVAHCGNNLCPLYKGILYVRVYDKVHISLTIAELRVCHCIKYLILLLFNDRKHSERFAEHGKFFGVNGLLAGLCYKGIALYSHNVAYIQQFLEDSVVKSLVFSRAKLVSLKVNLNLAKLVLNLHKSGCSHNSAAHYSAGNAYVGELSGQFVGC